LSTFLFGLAAILLTPVAISVTCVLAWPHLSGRPILLGVIGSLVGLVFACAALYWVTLPLQNIGVSGSTSPGPSPNQIFAPRVLVGLLCVAAATAVLLWITAKIIGRGTPAS
jgi:hypothetical protein